MRTCLRLSDSDRIPQANIVRSSAIYRDEPQQNTPDTPDLPDSEPAAPRYAGLGLLEDIAQAFAPQGPRGGRQGSLASTLHRSVLPLMRWLRKNPCYHGRYGQMPKAKLHALMAAAGIARSTRYDHLVHLREHGILRDGRYGMVDLPGFNDPDAWAHHAQLTRQKTARMRRYRGSRLGAKHPQKVRDSDCAPHRRPQNPSFSVKFGMWCQSSSIGFRLGKAAAAYRRTPPLRGNGRGTRARLPAARINPTDPAWLATLDAIAAATAAAPSGKILLKDKQPAQRAFKASQATPARSKMLPVPGAEGASAPVGLKKESPKPKTATSPAPSGPAQAATTATVASPPPVDAIRARALQDKNVIRATSKFTAMVPPGVNLDAVDEVDPPVAPSVPPANSRPAKQDPWEERVMTDRDLLDFNSLYGTRLSIRIVRDAKMSWWALSRGHYKALHRRKDRAGGTLEKAVMHASKQVKLNQWRVL